MRCGAEIVWTADPHRRLPSEPALVSADGAARETVRRALEKLQQDGLVYRRQSVGTFVAEPRVDQALDQLFSFTEFMNYRGLHAGSILLKSETQRLTDPSSLVLKHLRLKVGARVLYLHRLRTGSREPLVLASTWLPEERFSGFLKHDMRRHSVYRSWGGWAGGRPMRYRPSPPCRSIRNRPAC